MAPSSSPELGPELGPELDPDAASELVEVARRSICAGFHGRGRHHPDLSTLPPVLREPRGAFVTVLVDGDLNGCMGAIEPTRPLADVVAAEAWAAAFEDPRLPPLREEQLARVDLEVSVLSDLEPMAVTSLDELLDALRPGADGLVIEAGSRRGLFLPQVWDQLPEPVDFVAHLQSRYRRGVVAAADAVPSLHRDPRGRALGSRSSVASPAAGAEPEAVTRAELTHEVQRLDGDYTHDGVSAGDAAVPAQHERPAVGGDLHASR